VGDSDVSDGETRNDVAGSAENIVQARDISGGVHFHYGATSLPVPRQLPPDVVYFTDRETYMAQLHAWLDTPCEDAAPAEVIAGTGGVGKTSLAAHWAHQVRDRFPDGDLYVDLRGYHVERAVSAEEALDQLLRTLGVSAERIPVGVDAKAALYRSLLHKRKMLIILDNAATVGQVRPLLPGSPSCRVLITSRSQLTGLTTREGAHRIPLDVLPPERAIQLLTQIVGAERMQDDHDALAELIRYCGYLPLALRIAAERLVTSPYFSVADIVAQLAEVRERLDILATDDDFTTVRSVFYWSYRALPPDVARMFRLLGLPAGPDISARAAAVLAGVTEAKSRQLLDALVGAHLLQQVGPRRYRFHDLLRVYAAERAEADEPEVERRAAVYRLLTWYARSADAASGIIAPHLTRIPANLADSGDAPPEFPDRLAALHWCDEEYANIVAAVGQAEEMGEHSLVWQLPMVLFAYLLVRRPFIDWITTHNAGIASAELMNNVPAQVWLRTSVGLAHREVGEYDLALENFRLAVAGWRRIGQLWGEAWALRDIGKTYHILGHIPEAIGAIEPALAIHIAEGDTWGEAVARTMLALAHHSLGHADEALADLHRALNIYRDHGDQRNVAGNMSNLGLVYGSLGQTEQAIEYLEQALAINRAVDFWHGEALAHERLGIVLRQADQIESSNEHLRAAAVLYDALGDPHADEVRDLLAG
jgi:tetratricopeptide (TPR) repeat protein